MIKRLWLSPALVVVLACSDSSGPTTPPGLPPEPVLAVPEIVTRGDTVWLDASASSDPDGDALEFTWRMVSRPNDSGSALLTEGARAWFRPDRTGPYTISVTASDGSRDSSVVATTTSRPPTIEGTVASPLQLRPQTRGPNEVDYVLADVTMRSSLMIHPGVQLAMATVSVEAGGSIAAVGSSTAPIHIRGHGDAEPRLLIQHQSMGNRLEHVELGDMGRGHEAEVAVWGEVRMTDVAIYGGDWSLAVHENGVLTEFERNHVRGGLALVPNAVQWMTSTNLLDYPEPIGVHGGTVRDDAVWVPHPGGYSVNGRIEVAAHLRLDAGVAVDWRTMDELVVAAGGHLEATEPELGLGWIVVQPGGRATLRGTAVDGVTIQGDGALTAQGADFRFRLDIDSCDATLELAENTYWPEESVRTPPCNVAALDRGSVYGAEGGTPYVVLTPGGSLRQEQSWGSFVSYVVRLDTLVVDAPLHLEPGVHIEVETMCTLLVTGNGSLHTPAWPDHGPSLHGMGDEPWGSVVFDAPTTSVVDGMNIRSGGHGCGGEQGMLVVRSGRVELTNSTISDSGSAGVVVDGGTFYESANEYVDNAGPDVLWNVPAPAGAD